MSLRTDLDAEVKAIFAEGFVTREGQVVPSEDDLKLSNDAVVMDSTVLYADISESTKLVDSQKSHLSAELYKAFLRCAAKIIRAEGGTITAFDGDRVMAVYIGGNKNTSAVRTGLKINWVVRDIIAPLQKAQYPQNNYVLKHTVGIDTSSLYIVRGGIRGNNDLLWIGRASNYAAKLTTESHDTPTWITQAVYEGMGNEVKYSNGTDMWQPKAWSAMNGIRVYCSTYWWSMT